MRLVDLLQITAAIIGVLASAFTAVEGRLIRRFRRAAALSAEKALDLPPLRVLTRWRISRLKAVQAIREVDPHRLYLDEKVYKSLRKKRALFGVIFVILTLFAVILVHAAML